jgi:hypothetical protein
MSGVVRTTVHLPRQLRAALERRAVQEGLSEAELIRRALRHEVGDSDRPCPRLPLVTSGLGDPTLAERVDDLLGGLGAP